MNITSIHHLSIVLFRTRKMFRQREDFERERPARLRQQEENEAKEYEKRIAIVSFHINRLK